MDILWSKHLRLLACFVMCNCLRMTHTSSEGVSLLYCIHLQPISNVYTSSYNKNIQKSKLRETFNYTSDLLQEFPWWFKLGASTVNYSTIVQYKIQEFRKDPYFISLPTKLTFTCWPWYFGQFPSSTVSHSLTISAAESLPMSPSACRAEASKRRQALCRRTMCRGVSRWPWMLSTLLFSYQSWFSHLQWRWQ